MYISLGFKLPKTVGNIVVGFDLNKLWLKTNVDFVKKKGSLFLHKKNQYFGRQIAKRSQIKECDTSLSS